MKIILIEWMDGFPCIKLPTGIILHPDVSIINPIKPKRQRDFTKLQKIKEKDCYKELLRELKERFKDKKE
ncbi:MAG: hypothetical protein ACXAAH_00030 [Promethearchaeota archaeon]|jgi:hypothetical protein